VGAGLRRSNEHGAVGGSHGGSSPPLPAVRAREPRPRRRPPSSASAGAAPFPAAASVSSTACPPCSASSAISLTKTAVRPYLHPCPLRADLGASPERLEPIRVAPTDPGVSRLVRGALERGSALCCHGQRSLRPQQLTRQILHRRRRWHRNRMPRQFLE
jgi:hypothetical protein